MKEEDECYSVIRSWLLVVRTRRDDRFIELEERAAISNRVRADLFVSIHADAAPNGKAFGTTLYIEPKAYARTRRIAASINRSLAAAGFDCRPIRRAEFRVLVENKRPAVLIECGYMTNPADAAKLNAAWYRNKIAREIARGIAEFFGRD